MKLQNGHNNPDRKARQERALERRRRELSRWKLTGEIPGCDLSYMTKERRQAVVEAKIETAEAEIATLERKLGVVKSNA